MTQIGTDGWTYTQRAAADVFRARRGDPGYERHPEYRPPAMPDPRTPNSLLDAGDRGRHGITTAGLLGAADAQQQANEGHKPAALAARLFIDAERGIEFDGQTRAFTPSAPGSFLDRLFTE